MFNIDEIKDANIKQTLEEVYKSLKERGYNPINQLTGYIITGDPGYISNYNDSRTKICNLDRTELVVTLIKDYLKTK